MFTSVIWIILLVNLTSTLTKDHVINRRAEFSCDGLSNGKYKHEYDCRKFYWCLNNIKISDSCGENLAFDTRLSSCQPLSEVPGCGDVVVEKITTERPPTFEPQPQSFCTDKSNGLYRHVDCKQFYRCKNGQTSLLTCPLGYVFNQQKGFCTVPEEVPECNGKPGVITVPVTATPSPSDFSCLNRPDGFYRHSDCRKYYRCYSRKLQTNTCPNNLYFNPDYVYCDYPSNVLDCVGGTVNPDILTVITTKSPIPGFCTGKANGNYPHNDNSKFYNCYNGQTSILSCSNGQVFNPNAGYCTADSGGDGDDGKLSCINRDDGFYRHPDCSKYYRCIENKVFVKSCPPNLYYNPEYFYCDYPANVPDCIGGTASVDIIDKSFTTPSSVEFCTEKKNGFYSHPDCSKFYSCYKGKTSVLSCSYGLAFNPRVVQCTSYNEVPECKGKLN